MLSAAPRMSTVILIVLFSACIFGNVCADDSPVPSPSLEEVISKRGVNGTIILTIATSGYLDLLGNFMCRFEQLDIQNYIVGAVDQKSFDFCVENNIPTVFLDGLESETKEDAPVSYALFDTHDFRLIVRQKQLMLWKALKLGYNVLMVDLDVFMLQRPFEYLLNLPRHDYVIQSGCGLFMKPYEWVNAGFMFVRPTYQALAILDKVMELTAGGRMREGYAFNSLLCNIGEFHTSTVTCMDPKLKSQTLILPRTLFPTGDVFFRDLTPKKVLSFNPYIVHFTHFRYGDKQGAMKEMGMWVAKDVEGGISCVDYSVKMDFDYGMIYGHLRPPHMNTEAKKRNFIRWVSPKGVVAWTLEVVLLMGCLWYLVKRCKVLSKRRQRHRFI